MSILTNEYMDILCSEFYDSTQKIGSDKTRDTRDEDSFFYINHIFTKFSKEPSLSSRELQDRYDSSMYP